MARNNPQAPNKLMSVAVDEDSGDVVLSFQCEEDARLHLFLDTTVANDLLKQLTAKVKK